MKTMNLDKTQIESILKKLGDCGVEIEDLLCGGTDEYPSMDDVWDNFPDEHNFSRLTVFITQIVSLENNLKEILKMWDTPYPTKD